MNSKQFIVSIRRLGRKRDIPVMLDKGRGKGSHALLAYGNRQTIVAARRGDIGKGLLNKMLRDLGLTRNDLN